MIALAIAFASVVFAGESADSDAEKFNRSLSRGVNLGNALEAPAEGDWGVTLKPEFFAAIHAAGFHHVRIPICWSAHAAKEPPFAIEQSFLQRVDWALKQARANSLIAVINMHHYDQLENSPDAEKARFLSIWRQIAERFQNEPDTVAFEIYNEPCKAIDAQKWNSLCMEALAIIREKNKNRTVVIGPVGWNNLHQLDKLNLPDSDRNLIATFHYYEPFHFTHQGAEWIGNESKAWLGTTWSGTPAQLKALESDFDAVASWSHASGRPVYLGEFGAYSKADLDSRVKWTSAVQKAARVHGFSRAYWEFCSGFGCFDQSTMKWRQPLLTALTSD